MVVYFTYIKEPQIKFSRKNFSMKKKTLQQEANE